MHKTLADDAPALWDAILARGVTPCGLGARDTLRLEVCYPLHGNDISPETDPISAGLGWVVKGRGFVGEDAIARVRAEGPRHKLVGFKVVGTGSVGLRGYQAVEYSFHENGPSQHEIDLRYTDALTMADTIMTVRLVVKELAHIHGVHATFMPKPLTGVQGSGMHTHFSLFEGNTNAFADPGDEHGLSKTAKSFKNRD